MVLRYQYISPVNSTLLFHSSPSHFFYHFWNFFFRTLHIMYITSSAVLSILLMSLSFSFSQNDFDLVSFREQIASPDLGSNIPITKSSNLAEQDVDSDEASATTADLECVKNSEKQIDERETVDTATKAEWDIDPPFICNKGWLPACCVYPVTHFPYLCKQWGKALLIMCTKPGDWMCCNAFDKGGYGVTCNKDYTLRKKQPASACPVS